MKKSIYFVAMAAMFAACSSDDVTQDIAKVENAGQAISFDSYMGRSTRATTLVSAANFKEFGVFTYSQENNSFTSYFPTNLTPDFMYNQKVERTTTSDPWIYSPIKYWPNNTLAKVSFFAYTPYEKSVGQGSNPYLVQNGIYDGPALSYAMPDTLAEGKDLCWASSTDNTKQKVAEKIKFEFKHALSRVNFNVETWVNEDANKADGDAHGTGTAPDENKLDTNTVINIKSVKLVGNMATEGVLRLMDGKWVAATETAQSIDIMKYVTSTNTHFASNVFTLKSTDSVEVAMFDTDDYLLMIPGASFKIEITYDVVTTDSNTISSPNNSTVTNKITSTSSFELVAGKAYEFHLNLGLTSVKFEATTADWNTQSATEKTITEVALPNNQN